MRIPKEEKLAEIQYAQCKKIFFMFHIFFLLRMRLIGVYKKLLLSK